MVKIRNAREGSAGISRNPTVEMVVTVWYIASRTPRPRIR